MLTLPPSPHPPQIQKLKINPSLTLSQKPQFQTSKNHLCDKTILHLPYRIHDITSHTLGILSCLGSGSTCVLLCCCGVCWPLACFARFGCVSCEWVVLLERRRGRRGRFWIVFWGTCSWFVYFLFVSLVREEEVEMGINDELGLVEDSLSLYGGVICTSYSMICPTLLSLSGCICNISPNLTITGYAGGTSRLSCIWIAVQEREGALEAKQRKESKAEEGKENSKPPDKTGIIS